MWFNKGNERNQPTNLLGDYGYLKFNYDIDLGKLCPPGAAGDYTITLEFPRALFCDANTSDDDCGNKFIFTVQCPDIIPPDSHEPGPQCNEYDSGELTISEYCNSLHRMYDSGKATDEYGNEPDTCCGESFPNCDNVISMDGLSIHSLENYCKTTFNKYKVTEPENTFFDKDNSEIEPSEIEAICCGELYPPSCAEPERLIPINNFEPGIPKNFTTWSEYCQNNNFMEPDSPSENIPESGPEAAPLFEQCCGNKICPTDEAELEPPCENKFKTDRYIDNQSYDHPKSCCACEEYDFSWMFVVWACGLCSLCYAGWAVNTKKTQKYGGAKWGLLAILGGCMICTLIFIINTTVYPTYSKLVSSLPLNAVLIIIIFIVFFIASAEKGVKMSKEKEDMLAWFLFKLFLVSCAVGSFNWLVPLSFRDSVYFNLSVPRWLLGKNPLRDKDDDDNQSYERNIFKSRGDKGWYHWFFPLDGSKYIPGREKTCGDKYAYGDSNNLRGDTNLEPEPELKDKFKNYFVHGAESEGVPPGGAKIINGNDIYSCSEIAPPDTCKVSTGVGRMARVIYIVITCVLSLLFVYLIATQCNDGHLGMLASVKNKSLQGDSKLVVWIMYILIIVGTVIHAIDHTNMSGNWYIFFITLIVIVVLQMLVPLISPLKKC